MSKGHPNLLSGVSRSGLRGALLAGLILTLVRHPADAQTPTMIVHLPGATVESPNRLAGALTELARYLESRVAGLALTVQTFRRGEDAEAFLQTSGRDVVLIVSDPAFLLDLPPGFGVVPGYRFVRAGQETYRKLVVVKADAPFRSLVDLRGRSLSLAQSPGKNAATFLARVVFADELVPSAWFGAINRAPDDFSALADVLFGRTDAALVSEDNPLLAAHLGKDVRQIYTSPPVSRPVIAVRPSGLTDLQRIALDRALGELGGSGPGPKIFADLNLDGVQRIEDGPGPLGRAALVSVPAARQRTLEVARPGAIAPNRMSAVPALRPDQIPFVLGIELVDRPLLLEPTGEQTIGGRQSVQP